MFGNLIDQDNWWSGVNSEAKGGRVGAKAVVVHGFDFPGVKAVDEGVGGWSWDGGSGKMRNILIKTTIYPELVFIDAGSVGGGFKDECRWATINNSIVVWGD